MKRICLSLVLLHAFIFPLAAQVSQQWVSVFNGPGNSSDNSAAMTIDQHGSSYVTGESYSVSGNYDCVIIKYGLDGDTIWVRYYNGPSNGRDVGRSIFVDDSGSVYVTGESFGTGDYDIFTLKYNSEGVMQWVSRYNGPAGGADGGTAVVVDASGFTYVTGYSDGDPSSVFRQDDYVVIKYTPSGTAEWTNRYDGPSNFHDIPSDIAINETGDVYITGRSSGIGSRYDFATVKYNTSGSLQWVQRYNGPANYDDFANNIVLDDLGNIYVTGSSDGSSSDNDDFATIKYDAGGNQQWLSRFDGGGGGDEAYSMTLYGNNNLYITGTSRNPSPPYSYDYLTIRYQTTTGDTIWTARYNGLGNGTDIALSVVADENGSCYVTGYSLGDGSGNDYATIKYSSLGNQVWVERYNGSGNAGDLANTVSIDTSGNVFVSGTSSGAGTANDIVTIKYSQQPTVVQSSDSALPDEFFLFQNFPNPFNPVTIIKYQLPVNSHVSLKVYNLLGEEKEVLINEYKSAGSYQVSFNASDLSSGVYFYQFSTDIFRSTRKMLLIK